MLCSVVVGCFRSFFLLFYVVCAVSVCFRTIFGCSWAVDVASGSILLKKKNQVVRFVECVYDGSKMFPLAFAWIVLFELDYTCCMLFLFEKKFFANVFGFSWGCFGMVRSSFTLFFLIQFFTSGLFKDVLDLFQVVNESFDLLCCCVGVVFGRFDCFQSCRWLLK